MFRTSVSGWIAMLGVVSVASGCAGRVPGQAPAIDLRAAAPLAKLAVKGDQRAMAALSALATAADPKLATDGKVADLAAMKPGDAKAADVAADAPADAKAAPAAKVDAKPEAGGEAKADAPVEVAPAADAAKAVEPAEIVKATDAAAADLAAAKAAEAPKAEAEAPAIGFLIPSLAELTAAMAPTEDAKVLFRESFEDGLAAWVSRGLGQPGAAAPASDDDAVVLATSRARRSLWIKTRTEIDLAASAQPRLRLAFKGDAAPLKAVWETEHGAFPEEILLAPIEADEAVAGAPVEYDLTALKQRPGRLVLVARAPRAGAAAPVLDGVTIFDAAGPKLAADAEI